MSQSPLANVVREIREQAKSRISHLEEVRADARARLGAIEADLDSATRSLERLGSFEPERQGQLQCPYCWADRETWSPLVPLDSHDGRDFFQCRTCWFETSVALK